MPDSMPSGAEHEFMATVADNSKKDIKTIATSGFIFVVVLSLSQIVYDTTVLPSLWAVSARSCASMKDASYWLMFG